MDEKQARERIKKLYGCDKPVTAYIVYCGTRVGTDTEENILDRFERESRPTSSDT